VESQELRQALLDLGQEDLIPVWEAAMTCGVAGPHALADESERHERLDALIDTLADLARSRLVRVFVGPWENDPREVADDEALVLLRDRSRYVVEQELADDLDRVYFVNVENLPY
jgi:hypothetical protein